MDPALTTWSVQPIQAVQPASACPFQDPNLEGLAQNGQHAHHPCLLGQSPQNEGIYWTNFSSGSPQDTDVPDTNDINFIICNKAVISVGMTGSGGSVLSAGARDLVSSIMSSDSLSLQRSITSKHRK